tara:strand:- start:120 stop:290 length:171 start_codon:yes stop_codon:yes gene_type:complete
MGDIVLAVGGHGIMVGVAGGGVIITLVYNVLNHRYMEKEILVQDPIAPTVNGLPTL